jgi:hypothetical protein
VVAWLGFAMADDAPKLANSWPIEASGVPLCTAAPQTQITKIITFYQMLERRRQRLDRSHITAPAHFMSSPVLSRFLQPSATQRIILAGPFDDDLAVPEDDMLNRNSLLAFDVVGADQSTFATVGDASAHFSDLSDEQREQHYWKVAIVTLGSALKEPRYLAAATVSLQTALTLDAQAHPRPGGIR